MVYPFLFVVAVVFFFNILIHNSLSLPLSGDYSLQQIPFYTNGYDDWWKFLKTGEFPMWDYSTYLGVNNIGSNTFYYLLNPFSYRFYYGRENILLKVWLL